MSLLEDMQESLVKPDSDLGSILRQCKILAARLGNKPLEDWLLCESNGYPGDVDLPDYRTWGLTLKGHFAGPFGSGMKNAPIPAICLPEDIRESATTFYCRQSVSSIEQALSENTSGVLNASLGDLNVILGMSVYEGNNCIQAWGEFGAGHLVEVLNSVRNRILDFVLALEKEYPEAGEKRAARDEEKDQRITQVFNTTIHGGSMNLVGAADRSTLNLSNQVACGDVQSLREALQALSVEAADIADLEGAIQEEPVPEGAGFGPKVSSWIGQMINKAASGAWKVGLDVASQVLSKAVSAYYGQ